MHYFIINGNASREANEADQPYPEATVRKNQISLKVRIKTIKNVSIYCGQPIIFFCSGNARCALILA